MGLKRSCFFSPISVLGAVHSTSHPTRSSKLEGGDTSTSVSGVQSQARSGTCEVSLPGPAGTPHFPGPCSRPLCFLFPHLPLGLSGA